MINAFIEKGLNDITFITSPSNYKVIKDFCNKAYSKLNMNFVMQNEPKGPLHAFQHARPHINKPTLLLLGDTICSTDLDFSNSFLGYKIINDDSHSRWCLIKTDENEFVQKLIDKPKEKPDTDKVLIGIYYFKDYKTLKRLFTRKYPIIRGEYQLSSLIEVYNKIDKIKGQPIEYWLDTGTLEDYSDVFKQSISGRSFNSFILDNDGVIEKSSSYDKLKTEIFWLEEIEKTELKKYMPRFFGSSVENNKIKYKTQYINSQTLAEYLCFYPVADGNWSYIFSKLIETAKEFWSHKAEITKKEASDLTKKMLVEKTNVRIAKWDRQDILQNKTVIINGNVNFNVNECLNLLKDDIKNIINTSKDHFSIIHGDMCFSNILFAPENTAFKFIDPRGDFGKPGIYGDLRYDLAKFRHCYHGLYDYLIAKLYKVTEINNAEFEYEFLTDQIVDYKLFDEVLVKEGYNVDDIELIEGLLFISMIPLHDDDKNRQLAQYLIGLKCLNNQINKRGKQ
jgi:dTDP-glucose pyrophosphorylase